MTAPLAAVRTSARAVGAPPLDALPFDAVIFDLDGTLVDSEPLCYAAGVEACAAMGHDVPLAFFESLTGIDDRTSARLIGEHLGVAIEFEAFVAEWDRRCALAYRAGIPLMDGALDLLGRIAALGLPMALATSSRHGPAHDKARGAGLLAHFAAVVTFDDVAAAKPAPDAYLLAARRLGVDPARCLAFEDSEPGARAAHAAGMRVVQVAGQHPTKGPHAHHLAASLLEGARAAGLLGAG